MREILEEPSLIYFLVKKLKEKYPEKQIGKTAIQKLLFLLETKSDLDFDYTLYHYGPYSFQVSRYINLAEILGFIKVEWHPEIGYLIEPLQPDKNLLFGIKEELLNLLEKIVDDYGKFTAQELSIIATAVYIKNKVGIKDLDELVDAVNRIKPKYQKEWIKKVLIEGKVIVNNLN